MVIHENKLTAQEYISLAASVDWETPDSTQIEIALKNSIYTVSVEIDNSVIGMGRIIGDGARNFFLEDIAVNPDYQKNGIGTMIVKKLLDFIYKLQLNNYSVMVGLLAAKGKGGFYEKIGFQRLPNDYQECGMMLYIEPRQNANT